MPAVELVEVSPRDGLQDEDVSLSTAAKVELIERALAAGARRIEATSFVNPKRVPQMADAEAVMAALPPPGSRDGVSYIGLALNERGVQRAIDARVDEVNFVVITTETFNQRNQGAATFESVAAFESMAGEVRDAGLKCSVTIGASFGCPFEGEVPVARLRSVVDAVAAAGPDEISLADTIGVAVPTDVTERVAMAREAAPGVPLRCHFHNTRNTGLANAAAAVQAGVDALDASLGGIGGCPFAPAATGNIPSEDLVYLLERMGIETGIDLPAMIDAATWLEAQLGRPVPGMLAKAGIFPPST